MKEGDKVKLKDSVLDSFLKKERVRLSGRVGIVKGQRMGAVAEFIVDFPAYGRKKESREFLSKWCLELSE